MKLVIQRVSYGAVEIEGLEKREIGQGFVVLIGISDTDNETVVEKLSDKMLGLRIFADENGKTNRSLTDVGGELLLISQFTLYADCKKGNRPSFIKAGKPEPSKALYEHMIAYCKNKGFEVKQGEFGADMHVTIHNDGPFTIVLDSEEIM